MMVEVLRVSLCTELISGTARLLSTLSEYFTSELHALGTLQVLKHSVYSAYHCSMLTIN